MRYAHGILGTSPGPLPEGTSRALRGFASPPAREPRLEGPNTAESVPLGPGKEPPKVASPVSSPADAVKVRSDLACVLVQIDGYDNRYVECSVSTYLRFALWSRKYPFIRVTPLVPLDEDQEVTDDVGGRERPALTLAEVKSVFATDDDARWRNVDPRLWVVRSTVARYS